MTVQDTTPQTTFVGTGAQLSFTFTFRADDIAWLSVDFTDDFDQFTVNVDQDNNPGGTVEYTVAPPLNQELTVLRDTPNVQSLDYTRYDPFDSEATEDALDRLTMQIQDLENFVQETLTQEFDLLSNVDFATKVDGSMIYWDDGTGFWMDTAAEVRFLAGQFQVDAVSLFQGNVSIDANITSITGNFYRWLTPSNTRQADIQAEDAPNRLLITTPNLADVVFAGFSGRILQDAETLAYVSELPVLISDHTLLTNIGVNTHDQIDTHLADSTIHFLEASIDHTAIQNIGINSHGIIDSHIADSSIHYTQASIDHTVLLNIGTNTHAQIDSSITTLNSHIADGTIHFVDAPADGSDYVRRDNLWFVAAYLATPDHGTLPGLADDDHPQYHDGTLAYTGNLNMGGFQIQNIEHLEIDRINNIQGIALDGDVGNATNPAIGMLFLGLNSYRRIMAWGETGTYQFFMDADLTAAAAVQELVFGSVTNATMMQLREDGQITFAGAYSFPTADGSLNQVLVTDGAGSLVFSDQASSGFNGLGIWRFRTATDAFPTSGRMQFDNVTIDSATEMYINEVNDGGTDVSTFLALLVAGDLIYVQVKADASQFVIIEIGTPVLNADVWTFPIAQIEGQGTTPNNNAEVAIIVSAGAGGGVSDHFLLTNIGVNTHVQIDSHISDATIHFVEGAIDHVNILNIGVNSHAAIDTHIADGTIHFTEASIDHTAILNIGVNSHAVIDTHLASVANPHLVDVQQVYDATGGVPHIVLAAGEPFTIRDNAAPIGNVFILETDGGDNFFEIAPSTINFGPSAQRLFEITQIDFGYAGFQVYPDDFTRTDTSLLAFFEWNSTITSAVPGGGGVGNDGAPNFVSWQGECIVTEQANLFNSQSLFNQGTTITCDGANTGPIYTMINQPQFRTSAAGGARTGSQQNAVRSQLRVGPNLGGTFQLTSHETYYATVIMDDAGGAVGVTTVNYFAPKAPQGIGGSATITTLNCMFIPDIPITGITTLTGILSEMDDGLFINHTGAAESQFAAPVQIANSTALRLGNTFGIELSRPIAGVFRILGVGGTFNESLRFDMDTATADNIHVDSATGASIDFDFDEVVFGSGLTADGNNNWQAAFAPGAKTTTLGGDFSRRLFSAGGVVTIDAALSTFFTDTINEPFGAIGSGSVVNAGNVLIQTSPGIGTNRYGMLITAAPAGGTLNYALRVLNGDARFDARVDIDNPIALGGGAAPTLGTIGGAGPTAAGQAQWVEIDIGGVAHWVAVWT